MFCNQSILYSSVLGIHTYIAGIISGGDIAYCSTWNICTVFTVYLLEMPTLVPALHSGCYELTWEKCADLPSLLYMHSASVALHDDKIYTMAGTAPDDDTLDYDINGN